MARAQYSQSSHRCSASSKAPISVAMARGKTEKMETKFPCRIASRCREPEISPNGNARNSSSPESVRATLRLVTQVRAPAEASVARTSAT